MTDDAYTVQKLQNGEWINWSEPTDYFRAQTIARLGSKYGWQTRILDAYGQTV